MSVLGSLVCSCEVWCLDDGPAGLRTERGRCAAAHLSLSCPPAGAGWPPIYHDDITIELVTLSLMGRIH